MTALQKAERAIERQGLTMLLIDRENSERERLRDLGVLGVGTFWLIEYREIYERLSK